MPRFTTLDGVLRHCNNGPQTIKNWVSRRFITAYKTVDGKYVYDLDEIDAKLDAKTPGMLDKRQPFGGARVVQLPSTITVERPPLRAEVVSPTKSPAQAVVPDPSEIETEAGARP
jgi:hypothetical protein